MSNKTRIQKKVRKIQYGKINNFLFKMNLSVNASKKAAESMDNLSNAFREMREIGNAFGMTLSEASELLDLRK